MFYITIFVLSLLPVSPGIEPISPREARDLTENSDPIMQPLVLGTRGGYKDHIRGHLPTAPHINFDTLHGIDQGVPVQYLPEDLTSATLIRAQIDEHHAHILYAARAALHKLKPASETRADQLAAGITADKVSWFMVEVLGKEACCASISGTSQVFPMSISMKDRG